MSRAPKTPSRVLLLVAVASLAAACGGGNATTTPSSTGAATAPTASPTLLSLTLLKQAEVSASDLGNGWFAAGTKVDDSTSTGCKAADQLTGGPQFHPREVSSQFQYGSAKAAPQFDDDITTQPAAALKRELAALGRCKAFAIAAGQGKTLHLKLTPFNFGANTTGREFNGEFEGVHLNGYLDATAITPNVAFTGLYVQFNETSSKVAYGAETEAAQFAHVTITHTGG